MSYLSSPSKGEMITEKNEQDSVWLIESYKGPCFFQTEGYKMNMTMVA